MAVVELDPTDAAVAYRIIDAYLLKCGCKDCRWPATCPYLALTRVRDALGAMEIPNGRSATGRHEIAQDN